MKIKDILLESTYSKEVNEISKEAFMLLGQECKSTSSKEGTFSIKDIVDKYLSKDLKEKAVNFKNIKLIYNFSKEHSKDGVFLANKYFPTIYIYGKGIADLNVYDTVAHEVTHLLDFIRSGKTNEDSIQKTSKYINASTKIGENKKYDKILKAYVSNGDVDNANRLYEIMNKGTAPYHLSRVEFNQKITKFVRAYKNAPESMKKDMTETFEGVLYYLDMPYTKEFLNDKNIKRKIYERLSREGVIIK